MTQTRLEERKGDFSDAIARLQDALNQPYNEFLRDSVIQRFEFTYECAWKCAKLWLATKDIDVRNAKDSLKEALTQGLITDGNGWSELHRLRNLTSHTYDQKLADEVYQFIHLHAIALFVQLKTSLERS